MGCGRAVGDQTANLWWQLANGLLPRVNLPEVAVVMIGTNDLGFLDACSRWEADDLAAVPGIASRRAPQPHLSSLVLCYSCSWV